MNLLLALLGCGSPGQPTPDPDFQPGPDGYFEEDIPNGAGRVWIGTWPPSAADPAQAAAFTATGLPEENAGLGLAVAPGADGDVLLVRARDRVVAVRVDGQVGDVSLDGVRFGAWGVSHVSALALAPDLDGDGRADLVAHVDPEPGYGPNEVHAVFSGVLLDGPVGTEISLEDASGIFAEAEEGTPQVDVLVVDAGPPARLLSGDPHVRNTRGRGRLDVYTLDPDLQGASLEGSVFGGEGQVGLAPVVTLGSPGGRRMVVGNPGRRVDGRDAGEVGIFPLDATPSAGSLALAPTRISALDEDPQLGHRFVAWPDIDGDGREELIVQGQTRSYLFLGGDLTAGEISASAAVWSVNGRIERLPDLDGDGQPELAVRAGDAVAVYASADLPWAGGTLSATPLWSGALTLTEVGDVTRPSEEPAFVVFRAQGAWWWAMGAPYAL